MGWFPTCFTTRIRYWVGYSFVPVFLEVFTEKKNFLASQLPADVSASQTLCDQQNYQDKKKPFTSYVDSSKVVGKAPALFSSIYVQHPLGPLI